MPKPIQLETPCEVCGKNEWWDNRETKKSPKMPDYKCANKECRDERGYPAGRWLPKGQQKAPVPRQEPAGAPQGGRLTPDDTTPDERGERVYTWQGLAHTYGILTKAVVKGMLAAGLGEVTEGKVNLDQSAVQAGVATLLIQGDRAHIPLLHPRKVTVKDVQKPKPEPKNDGHLNPEPEDWEAMESGDWP